MSMPFALIKDNNKSRLNRRFLINGAPWQAKFKMFRSFTKPYKNTFLCDVSQQIVKTDILKISVVFQLYCVLHA